MKRVEIQINTINDIRNFVDLASRCSFEVDLASARYTVNGKSIMGVASLDKSKPLTVLIHTDNDEECAEFVAQLKPYMVD
ncbi:MAG: HPr family phosphocarrier protein [Ruminococcaceae bacterium]|nr:HPr family phosphocarrier protein [Oscillospiraceae bacterium]